MAFITFLKMSNDQIFSLLPWMNIIYLFTLIIISVIRLILLLVSDHQNKINKMICHPVRSSQVAISIDGNNDVGIWSLESGLRESAFFASQNVPPLSQDRDPQGYTIKSILFSADASVLFTGGNDRRIRAWSLVDPAKSNIVAQAASDQADGEFHYNKKFILKS